MKSYKFGIAEVYLRFDNCTTGIPWYCGLRFALELSEKHTADPPVATGR